MSSPVGRLAPSPTGGQHLGNARTFLIHWLALRAAGGTVLLRIEDIDSPRVKAGAVEQLIDDLRWLGLTWDGPALVQTQRLELYEEALRKLQAAELVYPCTCTRKEIELAASAPHAEHEPPRYSGTCASRTVADAAELGDRPYTWRFRANYRFQAFSDGFVGPVTVPEELGGDFIVWKSSRTPAYQLAVVVDDAAQGITEVARGDDLIPSTPRQLQLYDALGLTPPQFFHVPLVRGPDGMRLAKRHGEARLANYRAAGNSAEQLLGWLAWSCGWLARPTPITAADLIPLFRWNSIPKSPFVVEPSQLEALIGSGKP